MRISQEGSHILEQLTTKKQPQKMDLEKPHQETIEDLDLASKLVEAINVPSEEFANFAK